MKEKNSIDRLSDYVIRKYVERMWKSRSGSDSSKLQKEDRKSIGKK